MPRHATAPRCARVAAADLKTALMLALRSIARRVLALDADAAALERELRVHVREAAPTLLDERGVGPTVAAQPLVAWSHRGRLHSEAAFARLAGVAPLEATSGRTVRHRLNRTGDRAVNRALHLAVLSRLAHDPETQRYQARRLAEGKSKAEVRRCLKRHLARRLGLLRLSLTAVGTDHDATAVCLVKASSYSTGVSLPRAR